jgi:hypothetical protein
MPQIDERALTLAAGQLFQVLVRLCKEDPEAWLATREVVERAGLPPGQLPALLELERLGWIECKFLESIFPRRRLWRLKPAPECVGTIYIEDYEEALRDPAVQETLRRAREIYIAA